MSSINLYTEIVDSTIVAEVNYPENKIEVVVSSVGGGGGGNIPLNYATNDITTEDGTIPGSSYRKSQADEKFLHKLDSQDPDANKIYQAGGALVDLPEGGLATDMSNLDDDILEEDREIIRGKLNAAYEGYNNQKTGLDSGSLGGQNNVNSGVGSANAGGFSNVNSGDGSSSAGGFSNANSGKYSASVGGQGLQNQTFAEISRGQYNLSESNHADSHIVWHDDDLIEGVGGGSNNNRLNLFARYKNGAFYWIKKTLSTITNAVKGFHAADTDGRLNYYDGTDWKKYALEGEGSGGGLGIQTLGVETTQQDFQTMPSGIYYSDDSIVLNHYNFRGFVRISDWELNSRTIEITGWSYMLDEFQSHYYWITDNQDTTFTLTYKGNAFEVNSIKEQNNDYDLSFWTGSQAQYDAITTKDTQTLYIIN